MSKAGSIVANKVRKTYRLADGSALNALSEINFSVEPGEFISIVGPSGCGKSTLLKLIAGLIDVTGGSLEIGGKPVIGTNPSVAMVFQAPILLPWKTILENVLFPMVVRRMNTPEIRQRAMDLLELVGLKGFDGAYPKELSGGMQQRAAIVRALVQDPALLLMDEPFGALDAMTREQMNEEVLRLWSGSGKTVVFVTHSINEAVFLANRVFVMEPRPARLAEILTIDLPYPRTLDMINSDRFGTYATSIRKRLNAQGGL